MSVLELVCPVCKVRNFEKKYLKDNLYVCANKPNGEDGGPCKQIVAIYCKKCNKIINKSDLGLRGDVYECKECGAPHWGYTEYMRERAEALAIVEQYRRKYMGITESLKNMYN